MVKITVVQTLLLFLLAVTLNSCSKIWGEKGPSQKIVIVESKALPPFNDIFADDEEVAVKTLNLWTADLRSTFKQIEGEKKDFLSTPEITMLIRKGFIKMSSDVNLTVKKITGVLRLLGYKDGISKQNVENLIHWLETNRFKAKTFYRLFMANDLAHNTMTSRDLINLLDFFGSFISLGGNEPIHPGDMNDLLTPWIPDTYPHAKMALESGIELGISFFASFCGDRVELHKWNGRKVGLCLQGLTKHFEASVPVFDFIFDNLNPMTSREALAQSSAQLPGAVLAWLKDHQHPLFPTARVAKLADKLEIPAPYAFFKLTEWIPKLNADSNEKAFSPTFFIDLAQVTQNWISNYLAVTQDETCKGTNVTDWRACEFKGEYEVAEKLYNDEYATLIRSKTLGFVSKISFYDSVSAFLMSKFDPKQEGLAQAGIKDLITLTIRLVDSNAFAFNVLSRLQEKPYDPSTAENSLQNIHRQGLGELAALAADLIPEKAKNRRSFLKKLSVQIYDDSNKLTYGMDQLGITAFLYIYDLMTSLRGEYLKKYDLPIQTEGPLYFVKRRKIVENLPRLLHDHFPRIYNECQEWGFERTCGVVFTEVLPSPIQGRDDLETYEIDMITLSSILIESMINRCDRNEDDTIGTPRFIGFDGYNEKTCVLHVATALGKRMMDANIIEKDEKIELVMNLVKKVPFLKWIAKVALARGSMKGAGMIVRAIPPISLFSKSASVGSILSLTAEFMDDDKTQAIDNGTIGPHEDAGDELLYGSQLSEKFMPTADPAKRTSEKAKAWEE